MNKVETINKNWWSEPEDEKLVGIVQQYPGGIAELRKNDAMLEFIASSFNRSVGAIYTRLGDYTHVEEVTGNPELTYENIKESIRIRKKSNNTVVNIEEEQVFTAQSYILQDGRVLTIRIDNIQATE